MCTIYSILTIVSVLHHKIAVNCQLKKNAREEKRRKENEEISHRQQAQYVYERQSPEAQQLLCDIVRMGKKSVYSDVYILYDKSMNLSTITQLGMMRYSDNMLAGWIRIDETADSYCIYIKPPLNIVVEECLTMK